jgi:hypothetical protein
MERSEEDGCGEDFRGPVESGQNFEARLESGLDRSSAGEPKLSANLLKLDRGLDARSRWRCSDS